MAKFCIYCGRPLQEGEICNCRFQGTQAPAQSEAPAAVPAVSAAVEAAPVPPQAAPVPPQAAEKPTPNAVARYWMIFRDFFRAPHSVLPSFVASGDRKTALVFIITRAVCFALFLLTLFSQAKSSVGSFLGGLSSLAETVGASRLYDFPLARIFFLSLLLSAGASLLFAAIVLLFVKYAFKAQATYDNALCAAATGSAAASPFLLAGLLLFFVNGNIGMFVAFFGVLLQLLFTVLGLGSFQIRNAEKAVYAYFLIFAVQAIVILILVQIFAPMYLPDALSEAIRQVKSGGMGNLMGMLG